MWTNLRAMSLCGVVLLCFVCIHQVHGSEEYITGYSGQSVVLKTGADRSWNLTRVQWSIYKNTTYIASLKDGEVILYKVWRYEGRLDLNKETGDLTIHNVMMDDNMAYSVALLTLNGTRKQHKVNLTVQESLKTPEIQNKMQSLSRGQCYVVLNCTASGQNVNLSWTPDGEFNGSCISGIPNSFDSSLVLFASFSANRNVRFNCTASSGQQTVTRQITVGCSEEKQKREVCSVCSSCASSVIWSIVLTAIATALILYACTKHKDKIIAACPESPLHFIQNIRRRRTKTGNFSPGSCDVQAKKDME